MNTALSREEERFVRDLLTWDRTERSTQWILYHLFLILGGVVFVVAAFFTLRHLGDRTALWIMVPGSLMAILLFGLYIEGRRRIRERQLVASIVKKLRNET